MDFPEQLAERAVIAARAAQAALFAAQNPDFAPEDVTRAKDYARLKHLELDHDMKLRALDLSLPFSRNEQGLAAAALASVHREIMRLQAKLGLPLTPRHPDVTKADTMRVAYNKRMIREKITST